MTISAWRVVGGKNPEDRRNQKEEGGSQRKEGENSQWVPKGENALEGHRTGKEFENKWREARGGGKRRSINSRKDKTGAKNRPTKGRSLPWEVGDRIRQII